jgi:hypothetical protein
MLPTAVAYALALLIPLAASAQTNAPSLPFGQGRPDTAGIARITLKDDAKSTLRCHHRPDHGRDD